MPRDLDSFAEESVGMPRSVLVQLFNLNGDRIGHKKLLADVIIDVKRVTPGGDLHSPFAVSLRDPTVSYEELEELGYCILCDMQVAVMKIAIVSGTPYHFWWCPICEKATRYE